MRSVLVWNFVKYLNEEFMTRCGRNPAYSLRAYSRDLDTDSGTLSQMMSGKRKMSDKVIMKMATSMGFDETEAKRFVQDTHEFYVQDFFSFETVDEDVWHFHADWRHLAILVLMSCKGFKPDLNHIAEALQLEREDLDPLFERMVRMGVIVVHADGCWEDKTEKFITTRGYPKENNPARVLNHRVFQLGQDALMNLPYTKREFLSLFFEANDLNLERAREAFKKFRLEILEIMGHPKNNNDQLFCLAMGLFPVSKKLTEES